MAWPFLAMFCGQVVAISWFRRYSHNLFVLLAVGLAMFLVTGAVHGYLFAILDAYPTFFNLI
jgi:hypothetical protein